MTELILHSVGNYETAKVLHIFERRLEQFGTTSMREEVEEV